MRLLHTMLRVDYPGGKCTLAFVGYGDESDHSVLELTYNWGVDSYDIGDGYGHIALGVDDIYSACEQIKAQGGNVVREPGPMKHGSTVIAFVQDPTGYKVELIQLGTQGSAKKDTGKEAQAVG